MKTYHCAHCGLEIDIIGKGILLIADGKVWHKDCFLLYCAMKRIATLLGRLP